jgi:hypothetical protein
MSDQSFLSRVYDVKHRFEKESGLVPTQLFLSPTEMMELHDYIKDLERAGLLTNDPKVVHAYVLAGMRIIGLASDGMRAGISSV